VNCFRLPCSGVLYRLCTWAFGTRESGDAGARSARHVLRVPPSPRLPRKVESIGDFPKSRVRSDIFSHIGISDRESTVLDLLESLGLSTNYNLLSQEGWTGTARHAWHSNSAFDTDKNFDEGAAVNR
jgi:hypothetical protein